MINTLSTPGVSCAWICKSDLTIPMPYVTTAYPSLHSLAIFWATFKISTITVDLGGGRLIFFK